MQAGVAHLRAAGVKFGFIFTLTYHNLHELSWVAEYALAQGAALLQVHPLEEVGRGAAKKAGLSPDLTELGHSFVEVARLQEKFRGRLLIQYDVADVDVLRAQPERAFALAPADAFWSESRVSLPLSDLIAPIVIEADGAVVPLQYNFSRRYQIAQILSTDMESQIAHWKTEGFPRFVELCRRVHGELTAPESDRLPFVNWYGAVLSASAEGADSREELVSAEA
jgi:MoaA/NifB/PqqE/SkfB family radical SAM enzyme